MKKLLLSTLTIITFYTVGKSQCNFYNTAVAASITLNCVGGDNNKSAVAYNPIKKLYYSNNAGGSKSNEYFDSTGTKLGGDTDADFRGMWWNPSNEWIEGNTWNGGFSIDSLTIDGYLSSSSTFGSGFPSSMPYIQSIGAFDYDNDEFIYYHNDSIHRRLRSDGSVLSTFAIVGLTSTELSKLNINTVIYTGCSGREIGVYNYVDKILYLLDKLSGNVQESIAMPNSAPTLSLIDYFQVSYANDMFWLFDSGSNSWMSYNIFSPVGINEKIGTEVIINVSPNPTSSELTITSNEKIEKINIIDLRGKIIKMISQNNNTVDVSSLTKGMYFLQVHTDKKIVSKRFIKE